MFKKKYVRKLGRVILILASIILVASVPVVMLNSFNINLAGEILIIILYTLFVVNTVITGVKILPGRKDC